MASATTTSEGIFDDARTRSQPSSNSALTPLTRLISFAPRDSANSAKRSTIFVFGRVRARRLHRRRRCIATQRSHSLRQALILFGQHSQKQERRVDRVVVAVIVACVVEMTASFPSDGAPTLRIFRLMCECPVFHINGFPPLRVITSGTRREHLTSNLISRRRVGPANVVRGFGRADVLRVRSRFERADRGVCHRAREQQSRFRRQTLSPQCGLITFCGVSYPCGF